VTTREEISEWFDRGVEEGASHMLVIADTFDYEDYPSFVDSVDEARQVAAKPGDMQRVMEVYNLSMDKETQLNEQRSNNF